MKDLTVTMDERLTTTVQLQERLEFVARDAEERLQRQALEAQDGAARLRALTDFLKAQLEAKEHRMRTLGLMLTNPSLQLEAAPEMPATQASPSCIAVAASSCLVLSPFQPRYAKSTRSMVFQSAQGPKMRSHTAPNSTIIAAAPTHS